MLIFLVFKHFCGSAYKKYWAFFQFFKPQSLCNKSRTAKNSSSNNTNGHSCNTQQLSTAPWWFVAAATLKRALTTLCHSCWSICECVRRIYRGGAQVAFAEGVLFADNWHWMCMARHYCHVNVTIPSRQRALTQAYSNISKSTQAHAHTTTGQTRRRRHTACGRHNDDSKNASRNVSQSAVSRLVGGSFGQPICVNLSEVCKCMGVFVCARVWLLV